MQTHRDGRRTMRLTLASSLAALLAASAAVFFRVPR
jgi:hypothetical protein